MAHSKMCGNDVWYRRYTATAPPPTHKSHFFFSNRKDDAVKLSKQIWMVWIIKQFLKNSFNNPVYDKHHTAAPGI